MAKRKEVGPELSEPTEKTQKLRAAVLQNQVIKESNYEVDDAFRPAKNISNPLELHSIHELIEHLEKHPETELDARVLSAHPKERKLKLTKLNRKEFLETIQKNNRKGFKFLESSDGFALDRSGPSELVGQDYVPLLGGPFNKQLYIYDYLRMHSACFHAYHHDPLARFIVHTIRDFTLGGGFRVDIKNPIGQALWDAFCEANDFYQLFDVHALEMSIYGESMFWWLPNKQTKIVYGLKDPKQIPLGAIPRVRLIDPSVIWEIVTYPEDITRVLFYQWVAPTQYQIYAGRDQGKMVPNSKFIYQQIPADQVMHVKINSVSNEKRGRSDLFPVLSYLKRIRDSVQYSVLSLQKNMAWSIDTTIEGTDADIDNYIEAQKDLGTIPQAASEFVHTKKITRQYLANQGTGKGGTSEAFEWCLSMIAAGTGIPVSYFGTHLSGGQTRASALVATEPVTKKFEKRRKVYEQTLRKIVARLLQEFKIDAQFEVTFPELVTQDRSAKLKDLALAEAQQWISRERAAEIAAKEFDFTDYQFEKEQERIDNEGDSLSLTNPLTTPPQAPQTPSQSPEPEAKPSAITSEDRRKIDLENH